MARNLLAVDLFKHAYWNETSMTLYGITIAKKATLLVSLLSSAA